MANINQVISLGIGSPAGIKEFLTFGLQLGAAIIVPNVVGETQAQGTTDIQAVGLTASATFAYDAVVVFGNIISQNPSGGASVGAGSNVAIVVSLGPQPATSGFVGGGGGGSPYRRAIELKDKPNKHLKKILEDVESVYREIIAGPQVPAAVAAIVAPFTDSLKALPPPAEIDWHALEADAAKVSQLLRAWSEQQRKAQSDADDEWFLLSD